YRLDAPNDDEEYDVRSDDELNFLWQISTTVRRAKLAVDKVMTTPCETSVLYPKH
ncbi:hypothetical protein HN51_069712, partial [Arachis hypogaea]